MVHILNKAKQHAALLTASIFAVLLFSMAYRAIEYWRQDWVLAHQTVAPPLTPVNETAQLIASVADAHLFGKWLTIGNNMPITSLELRITGIVKGISNNNPKNSEPSKVYISTSGQPSKIYEEGDRLPSGVKVYEITPMMVILENNGQLEKLPLPRQPLQFKHHAFLESP